MGILESARECVAYRPLIHNLVLRKLSGRYRGSILGFLWTFLNPLLLMLVYTLVFTVYVRFDMDAYGAFVFCGLLPWLWFTNSLGDGTNSILDGGSLITKAMFPPEVLPVASLLSNLANFLLTLPILLGVLAVSGHFPTWTLVALPAIVLVQATLTLGMVMALSALNVQFRDVQHLLANVLTFWFFLCPILYPASNVPERLRFVHDLNFMGILSVAYQDVLFHHRFPDWTRLACVGVVAVVLLLAGDATFRRYRESFAEWL